MLIIFGVPIIIFVGIIILGIIAADDSGEMALCVLFGSLLAVVVALFIGFIDKVSLNKVDPVVVEKYEIVYNKEINDANTVYAVFKEGAFKVYYLDNELKEMEYEITEVGEKAEYIKWRKHKDGNLWQLENTKEWETVYIPKEIIKIWLSEE